MPNAISKLPRAGKTYVGIVIVAGIAALVHSAIAISGNPPPRAWLTLATLTLLTGSLTLKIPTVSARLSISEVFVFAAVLWFGPSVATFIVALDTFVATLWLPGQNRAPLRTLFNISAGCSAIWIASHLFQWVTFASGSPRPAIEDLLLPVALLGVAYFGVNSFLIATALSFEHRSSAIEIWRRNFLWLGLNHLVGASVAVMLVTFASSISMPALSVIVPLLVITYLMFRMSLGRLDDAHRHVSQVNEMYLSTIEALALAVDAKDQITHGHIRRVQVYTVELARRLGVRDARQLKAIEAAALLHDMGKLAIPEHILNKPGPLTAAEFDNMKRHTDIGADLLSSVRFPYPVVPIVRHHHENWDGTGYPTGLAGVDIPLGARILSVVDCFDALTSDRPYRPRLSTSEAFDILKERRGRMYDPMVVDAFISAHSEIAPLATAAGEQARSLVTSSEKSSAHGGHPLDDIRETAAQSSGLSEYQRELQRATTTEAAIRVASEYARLLTPVTACAVYKYFPDIDLLRCIECSGPEGHRLDGLAIKRGERVTGWAAANHRSVTNSKAELDLLALAYSFDPPLLAAIAAPYFGAQDKLLGVLTGYSVKDNVFTDAHRYAFERLSSLLGERLNSLAGAVSIVRFPQTERR
jgi:putative nucleotidyltransferase with HDIG domain